MNINEKLPLNGLDISQITSYLYISALPRDEHASQLDALGIRLILTMHWMRLSDSFNQGALKYLWLPSFDHPWLRIPMRKLHQGVDAALPIIQQGGAILTHCRAGVHRSVAMACCILIGMGYTADQAIQLVKEKRPTADPDIWYIQERIRKFEVEYKSQSIHNKS